MEKIYIIGKSKHIVDQAPTKLECARVFSHVQLLATPPDFSVHGIFPGKNAGTGCHFLLQGIFPTHGSNMRFLQILLWILYH